MVSRIQVGRLSDQSINALNNLMGETGRRERLLVASKPDVVGNSSQSLVTGVDVEDSAKLVLKVISTTRLKANSVEIKPGSPEASRQEVDMTIHKSASVVSEGKVDLVLHIEVYNAHDTLRRQE